MNFLNESLSENEGESIYGDQYNETSSNESDVTSSDYELSDYESSDDESSDVDQVRGGTGRRSWNPFASRAPVAHAGFRLYPRCTFSEEYLPAYSGL